MRYGGRIRRPPFLYRLEMICLKISEIIDVDKVFGEPMKQRVRDIAKTVASQIADELTEEAKTSIVMFYSHYNPVRYKTRHKNDFLKNAVKRYYKNPHNTQYYGGVDINDGRLSFNGYHSNVYPSDHEKWHVQKSYIYDLVMEGRHGATELFPWFDRIQHVPPVMENGPRKRVSTKYDLIYNHIDDYLRGAIRSFV